ncbi:hypothetical protein ACS5PN_03960 [Roseateles sp. NT4]|uniref:hypothetical protein n=1 Tax=Roseateles sp. NT4 TaxID=3453715 RepID=UPI003EECA595
MRAQDILPDSQNEVELEGVVVRKGTVGAFLTNARAWTSSPPGSEERLNAEQSIGRDLPALRALGLFEAFNVRDDALKAWIDAH